MAELTREYGAALFALACEKEKKKEYREALSTASEAFRAEPLYLSFLSSPGIPLEERLGAVRTAFAGRVPEDILSFLMLLCEKGRISLFFGIEEEYQQLLEASEHVSEATVTSAVSLTEAEKVRLHEKLLQICGHAVIPRYVIDPALLGGMIVEVDGKVLDGSLRHRLKEVKEVISR